jgi:hypothetical protein
MSRNQIFKLIYALFAILSVFFVAERVVQGAWSAALWPALIAAFCIYRLVTLEDES